MIGLLCGPSFAQDVEDEAPKYLLGDLGVRVDLPSGWNVTRWSDWDLKGLNPRPVVYCSSRVDDALSDYTDKR